MVLNCKPNDMAQVVRKRFDTACCEAQLGVTVKVLNWHWGRYPLADADEPVWLIEDAPRKCPCCGNDIYCFPDAVLKPLLPPDDVLQHDRDAKVDRQREREKMLSNLIETD